MPQTDGAIVKPSPDALDVLIIGAGPVGAALGLLLKHGNNRFALLEARDRPVTEQRSLALSYGSRLLLEEAGAWVPVFTRNAIQTIHVSHRGGFGCTCISAHDVHLPALGYVVPYALLQNEFDARLTEQNIDVRRGAGVERIEQVDEEVIVHYTHLGEARRIAAKILVLADGGANLGKVPAIRVTEKDYRQSALLGHVVCDRGSAQMAYERFTGRGPLALLPFDDHYSLVWIDDPACIQRLVDLDEPAFLAELQHWFGDRAGKFLSISGRRSYPLKLRLAHPRVAGRVVVVGNAAQALHPVAGQGFNLGLRDAYDLAALLNHGVKQEAASLLQRFASQRQPDTQAGVRFTDMLVELFSNDAPHWRIPRGLGLAALDLLPFARRRLAERMVFGASS